MELYRIIATCSNNSQSITLDWLPENFEGVKITQKFNFSNPMGYTPTYSLETMKVIKGDKTWCDNIFQTYGLQSIVLFEIFKLNVSATDYASQASFKIDFESYNKQDFYSEFALKANSCIDQYNDTKNTAQNFNNALQVSTPTTQKLVNYISVRNIGDGVLNGDNTGYILLEENEDSRVYNSDAAVYNNEANIYEFLRAAGTAEISLKTNGTVQVSYSGGFGTITLKLYKYNILDLLPGDNISDFTTPIATIASEVVTDGSSVILDTNIERFKIANYAFTENDAFFIGVSTNNPSMVLEGIFSDFSAELYVNTEIGANQYLKEIYYQTSEAIINQIFNNQATIQNTLKNIGVTSAQSILKKQDYISLIPKDFVVDFCLATGSVVNFKKDGTVKIDKIVTYFNTLLSPANAVEVTRFKDVQFSYDTGLNFKSVSVGMDQREYGVYTYFNDWNKIITFTQTGRTASENLDLSLTKFRVDYSGILDYINKLSTNSTESSSDMFFFNPLFTSRSTDEGAVYDTYTPRDILENWRKFLEFCFYNYSLDTLVLTSDGGDPFDLNFYGYKQFDDFILTTSDPIILPLKIEFNGIIPDLDYSENILKIKNNNRMPESIFGEYLYIFVVDTETTDKLSEKKTIGNLIFFPT